MLSFRKFSFGKIMKEFEQKMYLAGGRFSVKIEPFPATFFFIFVISAFNSKYFRYKILPMTGFEPWASGIRSDHYTDWATTTSQLPVHTLRYPQDVHRLEDFKFCTHIFDVQVSICWLGFRYPCLKYSNRFGPSYFLKSFIKNAG